MALTSTLAELAPQILDRVQDPAGTFWSLDYEVYPAIAEAISELLLLIGRPTAIFNTTITIEPNTCFQAMPSGCLSVTDIRCNGAALWKTTLRGMDYTQSSWGSSWQSDRAALPRRWFPLGLSMFGVHPAVLEPIFVQIAGVQYPLLDDWPYSGSDVSIFHKEINEALQMYSAAYLRVKETGQDHAEGQALYQRFLEIGRRLTTIETRKDDLAFSQSFGVPTAPSITSKR